MPDYYFDIETGHKNLHDPNPRANLDPKHGRIITIQFQQLDSRTGSPLEPLTILKEWESSEAKILGEFKPLITQNWWNFIPVGFNLNFEFKFLREKFKEYFVFDFSADAWLDRPKKDLKVIGVILNQGTFKGATLDSFTKKPTSGAKIPEWYREGDSGYSKILDYVKYETESFLTFWQKLKKNLPSLESLND
ncbi:MAG: hypothetical protein V3U49_01320 [Nitrososphaerales archaeon]